MVSARLVPEENTDILRLIQKRQLQRIFNAIIEEDQKKSLNALAILLSDCPELIDEETGENILHFACQFGTLKTFNFILENLSKKQVYDLARRINFKNNSGNITSEGNFLPVDCIFVNRRLSPDDASQIFKTMREIFQEKHEQPLRTVKERYPDLDPDSDSYHNLLLGHTICEYVKNLKLASWSDPSVLNRLTLSQFVRLIHLRKNFRDPLRQLAKNETHFCQLIATSLKPGDPVNCDEYAAAGNHHFKTTLSDAKDPSLESKSSRCRFVNSDHVFLMIGEIGRGAVICDPWAGKSFLWEEIPTALEGFRCIPIFDQDGYLLKFMGTTISYNKKVHKVEPLNCGDPDNINLSQPILTPLKKGPTEKKGKPCEKLYDVATLSQSRMKLFPDVQKPMFLHKRSSCEDDSFCLIM